MLRCQCATNLLAGDVADVPKWLAEVAFELQKSSSPCPFAAFLRWLWPLKLPGWPEEHVTLLHCPETRDLAGLVILSLVDVENGAANAKCCP